MKQSGKTIMVVVVTVILSFVLASYLVRKATIQSFAKSVGDMEAFNEIGRVESWDRVESLLVKGCTKEALELVKIEQSMALSDLNRYIERDVQLASKLSDRNPDVISRAKSQLKPNTYSIPTCK